MLPTLIVFGAKYLIALPLLVLMVLFFFVSAEQRMRLVLLAALSLPLTYILARIAGLFYSHMQPFVLEGFEPLVFHAPDNAFPSDHTAIASAIAAVTFFYNRGFGLGLGIVALGIGFARVAAGLHYPVDIIIGAILGVAAVFAVLQTRRVLSN